MGGKPYKGNDQISFRSSYILRVCQSSMEYNDQARALLAIDALCEAKMHIKFSLQCSSCSQLIDTVPTYKFYSCSHYICLICLSNRISIPPNIDNPNIEPRKLHCKSCSEGEAEFSDILKYRNNAPKQLKILIDQYVSKRGVACPICCVYIFDLDNLFTSRKCGHSFCRQCMSMYIENQVNQQKADIQIPCDCKNYLNQGEIRAIGSKLLFQRYLRNCMKKIGYNPDDTDSDSIFIFCMNKYCGENQNGLMGFWVQKSSKLNIANCPHCMTQHCVNCQQIADQEHKCHEKTVKTKDGGEDNDEYFIQKMIEQGKMQRCPVCGVPCILDRGCYYVTCNSAKCRRKSSFCFICGKILRTSNLHFDHYPEGPFVDKCNTTQNLVDPVQ